MNKKIDAIQEKLGAFYSAEGTIFRVWAPEKENIGLVLYEDGESESGVIHYMIKKLNGVHESIIRTDLKDKFYCFLVEGQEVTDPYSIASSVNSRRSGIIDLKETDPEGWTDHEKPDSRPICEEVIYELNVKDYSINENSGAYHRGKFLGLCEEKTKYQGLSTGIDHLKELGVTAVHLMPVYDFFTVDEREEYFHVDHNYNWGYDPELYNVPEGSYGTDPRDPKNRIRELKTMIMKLHKMGIRVILDVVYNHTYKAEDSNFNILNPGYYYRQDEDGNFSNGSGCGNEMATEKPMVRKFILESLIYWLEEYKVDGFRFDLMALMDKESTKQIRDSLRSYKSDVIIYGEPWAGGRTSLEDNMMTTKKVLSDLGLGMFNDDFRDAIKGDNDGMKKGFSQGNKDYKIETESGIVGGILSSPQVTINYVNSHDNLILYDKIKKLFPEKKEEELIKYNKFALSILFTSQGIPFIHEGNEFLRSKDMDKNSYKSGNKINGVDWSLKAKNIDFYNYVKDLISLRKKHGEFTLGSQEEIKNRVRFLDMKLEENLIAYTIKRDCPGQYILVVHNGNQKSSTIGAANIESHLKHWDDMKDSKIYLKQVMNTDGIIEDVFMLSENIEIPRISSLIYIVKIC